MTLRILLVDDEPSLRLTVGDALADAGHQVTKAADGLEAMGVLEHRSFDLVISDIRMPGADGMTLFRKIRSDAPDTDVILVTAYGEVRDAVEALRAGALDYLTKPFDLDELLVRVGRIAEQRSLRAELQAARARLAADASAGTQIIGRSTAIAHLLTAIETMASSDAPVLILGESGTGKELVARRLHELSERRNGPFVAVNCAAFPETLLEAELFGHERGAFTGAVRSRDGRFQSARGGVLLLDEIAEIPPMAQAKLLRVLQEGVVEPLGTDRPVEVDVRVLAATHRDLRARIQEGSFREDLYYRLNVLDISIPPLRERRDDLPLLVAHFLERFSKGPCPELSPRAWAALSEYRFPGNVRELEHAIERAVVLSRGGEIDVAHFPKDIAQTVGFEMPARTEASLRPLSEATKAFERAYLLRVLRTMEGRKTQAAEVLGISRKNLWEKLRNHGLEGDAWRDEV